MGSIQSTMVHADGRAEIGHHRVAQGSTQALALVHASPSMRCRQFGLSPFLAPKHLPQSVIIGPPPLTLLPPALALQKRNKRWGSKAGAGVCSVWAFVPIRSAANWSEKVGQRPVQVRASCSWDSTG